MLPSTSSKCCHLCKICHRCRLYEIHYVCLRGGTPHSNTICHPVYDGVHFYHTDQCSSADGAAWWRPCPSGFSAPILQATTHHCFLYLDPQQYGFSTHHTHYRQVSGLDRSLPGFCFQFDHHWRTRASKWFVTSPLSIDY